MSVFSKGDVDNSDSWEKCGVMSDLDGGHEGDSTSGTPDTAGATHGTGSAGTMHAATRTDACREMCIMQQYHNHDTHDNVCLLNFVPLC